VQHTLKIAIHIATALLAYLAAYGFVISPPAAWWVSDAARQVWLLAVLYAAIAALVELRFQTEGSSWRYVSVNDSLALGRSTFLTGLLFLLVAFVLIRADAVPRSVLLITWVLHLGGLATVRVLRRTAHEKSLIRAFAPLLHREDQGKSRLLILGELAVADAFLRELARDSDPAYRPVAILSLATADKGRMVRDVPVTGTVEDLQQTVKSFADAGRGVQAVLFLSPPELLGFLTPESLGTLRNEGLVLLRLPRISEVTATSGSLPSAVREVSLEELLARPSVTLDLGHIHQFINGKRVLVTGAGGSIGSEICRQVAAFGCGRLTMLDNSEFGLFRIGREIREAFPALDGVERLCDIRDARRTLVCVMAEAPDIIFHAAALKHVTLVEHHPSEGVLTNVIGTSNLAEAARRAEVRHMVMISTDKAVDPNNIMGATKRLAEAVVRGFHGLSKTSFSVVRFGNVLGSAGSVVPIFRDQIQRGGPVTVTDPEVERYFMTIPEAVQLVLHATAETAVRDLSHPSVFVLDMGAPVKILDLAKTMIRLQGLVVDKDIRIEFTGLRPGEKLTESLIDTNERVLSRLPSVVEVVAGRGSGTISQAQVRELEGIARSGDDQAIKDVVYTHVRRLREPVAGQATA
jgi:O-antigen biosynthesis protein WbqV